MRVGVMFANGASAADPLRAGALAQSAEALGYESLWAVQHVVMPVTHASRYPYSDEGTVPGGTAVAIPDPLVWLAWVGALTSRIRLATGVLVLPQQHPLVVAKQVATLDRLTGGRVILGVGAGWLREEFEALDAEFDHRGARFDEAVEVLRRAWWPGPTAFAGEHLSFAAVHVEPKPAGPVPIVIGGHTPTAARRAGRLADGFFPLGVRGDELAGLVATVRRAAEDSGRDPLSVELTVDAPRTAEEAQLHRSVGVDRVVVNAPNVADDHLTDALATRLGRVAEIFGEGTS